MSFNSVPRVANVGIANIYQFMAWRFPDKINKVCPGGATTNIHQPRNTWGNRDKEWIANKCHEEFTTHIYIYILQPHFHLSHLFHPYFPTGHWGYLIQSSMWSHPFGGRRFIYSSAMVLAKTVPWDLCPERLTMLRFNWSWPKNWRMHHHLGGYGLDVRNEPPIFDSYLFKGVEPPTRIYLDHLYIQNGIVLSSKWCNCLVVPNVSTCWYTLQGIIYSQWWLMMI